MEWVTLEVVSLSLSAKVVSAVATSDPPVRPPRQIGPASNLCTAAAWPESERARKVGGAAAGDAAGGELALAVGAGRGPPFFVCSNFQ